ncbi:PhzF family phenazine biosynthesis protein [Thermogemmatispora sp.]|uniref:PhzF family phenazine biosynthesis protein n=1 Tax=Thermogemmatispora sp. TaxID=1968838 RepID=UPI001D861EE9|nr:PhzF family phenazine biosynthesis protein [Thermogemmatispora sp.]MBX5448707.1 PhzF family phenazine biosynthesis protein [Thermogemmatispora sp.]
MGQRIIQVDAFTDRPFAGNPAAVCLLTEPRDAGWMQLVAREMNLSETAFLLPEGDGYRLRWFTPTVEVDLCGHATLASAHVLWEEGLLRPEETARFYTRSGLLTARRLDGWIEMDFPATPARPVPAPPGLSEALGVTPLLVAKNQFDYLVELESEEAVHALQPDFTRLLAFPARGFIVTSRAEGKDYDFVSRFFGPAVGVNEDPVTGSAHCTLAPFWCNRLGRSALTGYQASARGGLVRVRLTGERVSLSGQAVTVMRAECFF